MLLRSVDYPELRVHVGDVSVKFRDGLADVSDEVGATLVKLPGIESVAADPVSDSGEAVAEVDEVEAEPSAAAPVNRKPGRPRKAD